MMYNHDSLHQAIITDNVEAVKAHGNLIHIPYDNRRSALMNAVLHRAISVVEYLVQCTDVNYQDSLTGRTALHISSTESDPVCMRILLANGANPNIVSHDGQTIGTLYFSSRDRNNDVLQLLGILNGNYITLGDPNTYITTLDTNFQTDLRSKLSAEGIYDNRR